MSWLNEIGDKVNYIYKHTDDDYICGTKAEFKENLDKELQFTAGDAFDLDGKTYTYAGFKPYESGIMTKIVFEKNGRKGIRVKMADGTKSVRSMTRELLYRGKAEVNDSDIRYNEKGEAKGRGKEVESVVTKGFAEFRKKNQEKIVHQKVKQMRTLIEQSNAKRSRK